MSSNYGKIYAMAFSGSMFGKPAVYWAVWAYVIACQVPRDSSEGSDMVVEINPAVLAAMFGCRVVEVEKVLDYLCRGDGKSRTKVEGGRRLIREGQFTFKVVNGRKYRDMAGVERRREINRLAARRYRAKVKGMLPGEAAHMRAVEAGDEEGAQRVIESHLVRGG
jgi:hypothetical protein